MVEVQLSGIRADTRSKHPVMLLQEHGGARRTLPIFIGPVEADAIVYAVQGIAVARPLTHDLMKNVIEALGAVLDKVLITEMRDEIYHAQLVLRRDGREVAVDSRSSDAVALALRLGTPIFVADDIIEANGITLEQEEPAAGEAVNPQELLDDFQRFLDQVRPEDFSS